jgi:CMP-N-acetylneuraminic acid synthetase
MSPRVAIIPARGGSKGLPGKNLRELAGRPLIAHTIAAAIESESFGRIVVTSEDEAILEVAHKFDAEVLLRPAELATDEASSLDVLSHALRAIESEAEAQAADRQYALLQPTSPLRTGIHIRDAVALMAKIDAKSLVSVTESPHPPHKSLVVDTQGHAQPLFEWADLTRPRQQLPKTFHPNGAIYLGEIAGYLRDQNLFAAPLGLYEMDAACSIDIDVEQDLVAAQRRLTGG